VRGLYQSGHFRRPLIPPEGKTPPKIPPERHGRKQGDNSKAPKIPDAPPRRCVAPRRPPSIQTFRSVLVVGETPKQYRIEAIERMRRADRTRWLNPGSRPWSRDTSSSAIPKVLLDAHQQWKLWARQAKTLPSPWREWMIARAKLMANRASWRWTHPDDSQTVKTPCPPETLIERGFSPAMVAALTRDPPALGVKHPNLDGRRPGELPGRHRAPPLLQCLDRAAEP
jgi:hypothetical protein